MENTNNAIATDVLAQAEPTVEQRLSAIEAALKSDYLSKDDLEEEGFVTERQMEEAIEAALDEAEIPDRDDFASTEDLEDYVASDDLEEAVESALEDSKMVAVAIEMAARSNAQRLSREVSDLKAQLEAVEALATLLSDNAQARERSLWTRLRWVLTGR